MNIRTIMLIAASIWFGWLSGCGDSPGNNNNQDGGGQNCVNQCTEGTKQCSADGWQACEKQSNGCTDWGKSTSCPTGQICSGGQCRKNCLNQCTLGAKQCSGQGFQTCEQQNTGCTDWSEVTDCEGGKICSGGQCSGQCTNQCTEGAKQCSGNSVQTCEKQSSGCTDWGSAQTCPNGETCSGGNCGGKCTDQCTEGAKQCSGNGVQSCEKQSNGCTDWGNAIACANGETCSGGKCGGKCTNQCTIGSKQCNGSGYQTCEQKPNGCTDWSSILNCTNGEICSGGNCVKNCVNQCTEGAQQCSGTGIQKCEKQSTGCTDWGSTIPCQQNQICSGGKCVSQCVNQCTLGSKQCSGSGVQTCEKKASGCTDWGTTVPCATGKICSGGNCVQSCVNQCTENAKQCSGTGVQTCKKQATGCTDWDTPTACATGEICSGGRCVKSCVNQCTEGAKQCSGTGVQTCEKKPTGCTDWGNAVPCQSGQTCSGGTCVSNCTNQCTDKATRCNGTNLQTCKKQASGCTDWDTPQPCANGNACVNGACSTSKCVKGDKRCNANSVEECDNAGNWQITQVCPQVCSGGACSVSAQCTPNARQCNGTNVEECNATGTAWLYLRTCQNQCTAGACTGGCTAGAVRCNGADIETCKTDGSAYAKTKTCANGCIRGYCKETSLLLDNKTVTMDGEHFYTGDIILKNNSKITVGTKGWLRIYAANVNIDATSSIIANGKGNHPDGKGAAATRKGCRYSGCSHTDYGNVPASAGGYGTQGTSSSTSVYNCYSGGSRYCTASNPGGKIHGGYFSEIRMGSSGGGCSSPNGGGMVDLIAANKMTITGISNNNISADGVGASCGDGSGGGIRLIAEDMNLSQSVLRANRGGSKGGYGRIKILYGSKNSIVTNTGSAVVEKSIIPPLDLKSSTHPDSNKYYNDNFKEFSIAWTRPFSSIVGYYYKINTSIPSSQSAVPSTQSTFHTGETLSKTASALKAGNNYFHVVSVGPNATIGTVESMFKVKINSTPVTIKSTSHPSSGTWYNQTTIFLNWTNPIPDADVSGYYYVLDKYADTIPDKTDKFLPTKDKNILFANRPVGTIWYFHVIAQDTQGYLTKKAAHYKIQIGPNPGYGGISGEVRDDSSPTTIDGVKITLNRGLQSTTSSNGGKYFFSNNVYAGTYELRATKTGYEDYVKTVIVTKGQNTSLNILMKKKTP